MKFPVPDGMKALLFFLAAAAGVSCTADTESSDNQTSGADSVQQNLSGSCAENPVVLDDYQIYRGNTHSHTIYSWSHGSHRECYGVDCGLKPDWDNFDTDQGLPSDHFLLARENNHDFYVITDHSSDDPFTGENNYGWKEIQNQYDWAENFWQRIQDSSENVTGDQFVGLPGIEYSRNSDPDHTGQGHINAMNISGYAHSIGTDGKNIPELYEWLKTVEPAHGTGHVVASFNHPSRTQYNDWDYLDDEIADIITMFELRTVFRGEGPRWAGFVRALNKGWKVSPISVADNHGYWNIINTPNLTYLLAPELTKEAVTSAMKERRTYTSWAGREHTQVDLKYSVNGCIMGSDLDPSSAYNFHIELNTHSEDPGQDVRRIQILRNHPDDLDAVIVAAEQEFNEGSEVVWSPVVEDTTAKYFFLRIHHANDMDNGSFNDHGSTYSAPVWVEK